MENLNKKRSEVKEEGKLSGKKIRSQNEGFSGGVTAKDAELEEFLAILKRLQAGFDRFREKRVADCAGKSAVTPSGADSDSGLWNPGFELDDFKQFEDGGRKINIGDALQKDTVVEFDLNVDPLSD